MLRKRQKEALLSWIAEGLETDEINERAADFAQPFSVTRRQVHHYREARAVDLAAIQQAGEYDALTAGLALKEERVKKLQQLAALMERDLFGGSLWLDQVKMIGSGLIAKEVDYEEFNASEVQQYRGVLDDIAKETGGRKTQVEHSGSITTDQARGMSDADLQAELRKRGLLDA